MDAPWTSFMKMTFASSLGLSSSSSTQPANESEKESVKCSSTRTPLSSKAKPFRSSKTAGYCAAITSGFADSTKYPYSPELQDYVYLNMGNMTPSVVSGEESAGYCTGTGQQSVDSSEEVVAPGRSLEKRGSRLPSRTPSPEQLNKWTDVPQRQLPYMALTPVADSANSDEGPSEGRASLDQSLDQKQLEKTQLLQERRSLPDQLPLNVKRTFIHYDDDELETSMVVKGSAGQARPRRSESAPARLLSRQTGRVLEEHIKGTCKPCGYFFAKADGCRWHNTCTFCHLCPPGELKRRKKQKRAMLKARDAAQALQSPWAKDEESGQP